MTDYKMALKTLLQYDFNAIDFSYARLPAIEAVKKQIPTKPNGNYCPVCKRHLRCPKRDIGYSGKVKNRKGDNYCPDCGQALDWSDNNGITEK